MSVLDDAIALEERAWKSYTEAGKRVSDLSGKKILGLQAPTRQPSNAVPNCLKLLPGTPTPLSRT
jgi:hypothetical protein